VDVLLQTIHEQLMGTPYQLTSPVSVAHFETATFLEQVEFFANTDIVLSPHGAQLTGLAFLPRCGHILEIFPPYYLYDNFFGSLADAANKTTCTCRRRHRRLPTVVLSTRTATMRSRIPCRRRSAVGIAT
jgi:Glycosyltransferase 61